MSLDLDLDVLVETITKEILKRLSSVLPKRVLVMNGCPSDLVSNHYETVNGTGGDYAYVLMTADAYQNLLASGPAPSRDACPSEEAGAAETLPARFLSEAGSTIDLAGKRLLHERDLRDHNARRGDVVIVSRKTIITALAADYAKSVGVKIVREG